MIAKTPSMEIDPLTVVAELPDPFLRPDGTRIATPSEWEACRASIQSALLRDEYGHIPPPPENLSAAEIASDPLSYGATEKRIRITCGPGGAVQFHLHVIVPGGHSEPMPVLLVGDRCWGAAPIPQEIAARGYVLAEFDRTEIAPDAPGRDVGVYPLYPDHDWGAMGAWAWGYHRAVDYLVTQPYVDASRIAVTGHSRGGKATLLAGALDERIALAAPNNSGCGGAAPYRAKSAGAETLEIILRVFPYWFQAQLPAFIGREDQLPFDQHSLLALVAPRALLITNALGDLWADPEGTHQTYLAAREVFEFFGAGGRIANHYREGKHAHNADDWRALLDFADHQFFGKDVPTKFDGAPFTPTLPRFSWRAPRP
ncbi:hypothetical protein CCAX7_008470 [Capsulimonas corticalis]|uniref:4-O-methyl-glucuronoyl methylesterase-like domain-containing protein n=1 Tax=Capsulimonas corticalis TaxID=2219043 RepID=A0A402CTZ3_9BACT|nr:acetylxylan esterase [Capsulimonas corticalis]BDI28796.1 hypothetical protein CCAX7_008470 [Capsulimonas corticalis]